MILPNVRMSFGREEAAWLLAALRDMDAEGGRDDEAKLSERGIDVLLDDPRILRYVLNSAPGGVSLVPSRLAFYVLVRHALLESNVTDRILADYLTALLLKFGTANQAYLARGKDGGEYHYLVDVLGEIAGANAHEAFLLHAHLGDYALWLSGLFPDHIVARRHRRGGPGLSYYETIGRTAYTAAARAPQARRQALDQLYESAANAFGAIRRGLNLFSDRHLTPRAASPADRLLRQVSTEFRAAAGF